jgi:serine/threonine protein kinase
VDENKPFETEQILMYIAQISLGLLAMHDKKILHRDIKTQNIFITGRGVLKIGDFGIAKDMSL